MIRVFGPLHVSAKDWPEWRRSVQPLLRIAGALVVIDLLMVWALLVLLLAKHVRLE